MHAVYTQIISVLRNPIFLAAVSSWCLSQLVKTMIALYASPMRTVGFFFDMLVWRTGGMPSSHTALVSSLTTAIGCKYGCSSDLFVFALFFALIVIRDAMGVRRSNGLQAKRLNEIGIAFAEITKTEFKPVKEVQGHRPVEVFAGIIVGVLIGMFFSIV